MHGFPDVGKSGVLFDCANLCDARRSARTPRWRGPIFAKKRNESLRQDREEDNLANGRPALMSAPPRLHQLREFENMKRIVPALIVTLISSGACAETITVGCPLVNKYSAFEVNLLLSQARSVLSAQEVNGIYHRYVSLRNACQTNANASGALPVSSGLRSFLSQKGIDVTRLSKL